MMYKLLLMLRLFLAFWNLKIVKKKTRCASAKWSDKYVFVQVLMPRVGVGV